MRTTPVRFVRMTIHLRVGVVAVGVVSSKHAVEVDFTPNLDFFVVDLHLLYLTSTS